MLILINNHNLLVVENEYHVFLKCVKFDTLRNEYLNTWYQSGDSFKNFHNIISTTNPVLIKKLCIYINELLKLKENENSLLFLISIYCLQILREILNLNISYVIGDLDNLDNTSFKIEMCCLVSLDDL